MEVDLPQLKKWLDEDVVILFADRNEKIPLISDLKLLSMGAEAYIFKARFMGVEAVVKWRFPKNYIPEELDEKMRRSRTKLETKILWKALSLGI
jgi:hypothetical protein